MTVPSVAGPRPPVFRAGLAVNRALSLLVRNFLPFWLVAALVTLPNLAVEIARGDDLGWMLIAAIVSGVLAYLCQAILADAAFAALGGGAVDIGRSARSASSRFPTLMGLAGWVGLAVGIGFVLLIVPGIIATVMFSVAVPVCVVERLGAVASMQRSAALTAGYRWPLFWLYVVLALVVWMTLLILQQVLAQIGGDTLDTFGTWAAEAAVTAFHAVLAVVVYEGLCAVKEGTVPASATPRFQ